MGGRCAVDGYEVLEMDLEVLSGGLSALPTVLIQAAWMSAWVPTWWAGGLAAVAALAAGLPALSHGVSVWLLSSATACFEAIAYTFMAFKAEDSADLVQGGRDAKWAVVAFSQAEFSILLLPLVFSSGEAGFLLDYLDLLVTLPVLFLLFLSGVVSLASQYLALALVSAESPLALVLADAGSTALLFLIHNSSFSFSWARLLALSLVLLAPLLYVALRLLKVPLSQRPSKGADHSDHSDHSEHPNRLATDSEQSALV
jgi:hypothetical protein